MIKCLKGKVRMVSGVLKDEKGNLAELGWWLGGGAVVVAIILILLAVAPDTMRNLFVDFVDYMRSSFGF